jgi:uncharacterized protein (TIGR00255 family)
MTGFGDAQLENEGYSFLLEIKSLNNRFLKTVIRLPDALSAMEPEVERSLRENICRGSVNYTLHMRNINTAGPYEVNQAAIENYLGHLQKIATQRDDQVGMNIDLASILQLPGVCQVRTFSEDEHKRFLEIIDSLTSQALVKLQTMRKKEGEMLLKDLHENCDAMRKSLDALAGLTDEVVDLYRKRIQTRVDSMLAEANLKLDEEQLRKEIALYAERSDINEEVSRLAAHLDQFDAACQSNEQAGRRLDFLTQEMLREANTIASKSNYAEISHHVVDIKVAIDRLKEQVQNIE